MVVCIVSVSCQKINSRTKRTDARQSHTYSFEKLDQLLREQPVRSFRELPHTRPSTDAQAFPFSSQLAHGLLVAYINLLAGQADNDDYLFPSLFLFFKLTITSYLFLYDTLDVSFLDI